MLYTDRLKLIKSMIVAKEDDGPMLYAGGYNVGGVHFGGIPLDDGEDHEFERKEISEFIQEEIENLKKGQTIGIGEKRAYLQNAKVKKEQSELELTQTPKHKFIKRSKIKKELQHNKTEFERAQLLVDMKKIDSKHINLLEQISDLLIKQENGKNKYKRKDIKKYINYAIYRIEQQEKSNINEDELAQHSFFQNLRVTGSKINEGHYGESAKRVIQDWSLSDR